MEHKRDTLGTKVAIGFLVAALGAGVYIKYDLGNKVTELFKHEEPIKVQFVEKELPARLYHLVKLGDTGYKIAKENGLTTRVLKNYNPNVNWYSIAVGDTIWLSGK